MWHGYVLIEKPDALTVAEWNKALTALERQLDGRPGSSMPARRLQSRRSLDGTKVILEATFDERDLDVTNAQRLPRYISEAIDGKQSPTQVQAGLQGKVTVFTAGSRWFASGEACRAYLSKNAAQWESTDPVLKPIEEGRRGAQSLSRNTST